MSEEKPWWDGKQYAYFRHEKCEFFPCHTGVAKEDFNCLFCYCPLYALGDKCGGGFTYTQDGMKDCSACTVPHRRENYGRILERYRDIAALAAKKPE